MSKLMSHTSPLPCISLFFSFVLLMLTLMSQLKTRLNLAWVTIGLSHIMTSNVYARYNTKFDWLEMARRANQITRNINFTAFDIIMKKIYSTFCISLCISTSTLIFGHISEHFFRPKREKGQPLARVLPPHNVSCPRGSGAPAYIRLTTLNGYSKSN